MKPASLYSECLLPVACTLTTRRVACGYYVSSLDHSRTELFIARANIDRFELLLRTVTDPAGQAKILALLSDERQKLEGRLTDWLCSLFLAHLVLEHRAKAHGRVLLVFVPASVLTTCATILRRFHPKHEALFQVRIEPPLAPLALLRCG